MSATNAAPSRVRGVYGADTRAVLLALREPARVPALMAELGWTTARVWDNVKGLYGRGLLERPVRGVYRITPAGEAALAHLPPVSGSVTLRNVHRAAPLSTGRLWSAERVAWLKAHYAALGHRRAAELLNMEPSAVHAKARKLGLEAGDVAGYVRLTDVANLVERDYVMLWSRAQHAGVLTYPVGVKGQQRRTHALVPDAWVETVLSEWQPPTPDDVALCELRAELGLSRTHAQRLTASVAYLRTPVKGGQARLYVSTEDALRLRQSVREAAKTPRAPVVGRAGILQAIEAGGEAGRSERELFEALPCSRAAVRIHVLALRGAGTIQMCRTGTTLDPFVYRAARFVHAPEPPQRVITISGRPRKVLAHAAD
ncbi:winged helix-turn-helix domain-containing protein [Deinococcus sp. QL22]|uniref:winged helix-turn-helix domain-containing protein n=1 Tax=Deinococcus sp. QL22 TaxID=2939437 RepID=UPI002016D9A9|nr:winged helix-turn-helix domain-containing protein [Deinococcus sp. QL22]UQN10306.1 winged helix-turn-helix domain-containing protein [Deinococcus sp. QL22]UQN10440.1 winged helix-turn-helix domain-containing protein [Deinococcus sp. QL22]